MSWSRSWLTNSLRHQLDKTLASARECRAAHRRFEGLGRLTEHMATNYRVLAEAYEEAAQAFERRLALLEEAAALARCARCGSEPEVFKGLPEGELEAVICPGCHRAIERVTAAEAIEVWQAEQAALRLRAPAGAST